MLQELPENEVQKGSKNSECLKTYGANILKPKYILVAAALFIEIFYSQVPAPLLGTSLGSSLSLLKLF